VPSLYLSYAICDILHGSSAPQAFKLTDRPYIAFVGKFSRVYSTDELVRLVRLARSYGLQVVIVGTGDAQPELVATLQSQGLSDTAVFTGYLPFGSPEMAGVIGNALACFLPLEDTVQNRSRCPSKLFNYAALHRPIITSRVGAIADILGDQGTYYQYGDDASLATCLGLVAGGDAKEVNIDYLTWERQAFRFYAFLRDGCAGL
jgi:glycosyltransferase involved in cell wall biosynthesis